MGWPFSQQANDDSETCVICEQSPCTCDEYGESEGEFGCMQTDDATVDFVEPARWDILKSIFG
jgi:hypothetical protein